MMTQRVLRNMFGTRKYELVGLAVRKITSARVSDIDRKRYSDEALHGQRGQVFLAGAAWCYGRLAFESYCTIHERGHAWEPHRVILKSEERADVIADFFLRKSGDSLVWYVRTHSSSRGTQLLVPMGSS